MELNDVAIVRRTKRNNELMSIEISVIATGITTPRANMNSNAPFTIEKGPGSSERETERSVKLRDAGINSAAISDLIET